MYNVFLTSQCNLQCEYCFAEPYMRPPERDGTPRLDRPPVRMDAAGYEQVLEFLIRSGVPTVSLLGGEPTLHPEFAEFVELSLEKGLQVSVKSNATWGEKLADRMEGFPLGRVQYLLNVNPPQTLGADLWQRICRNTRRLTGARVDLQLNIARPDFEYSYIIDLAKSVGSRKIVWSLSSSFRNNGANVFDDPLQVRELYSSRILEFVAAAGSNGIATLGVHGVTPCMFSDLDYGKLLAYGGNLRSTCTPVFDIMPDLSVHYCFPLAESFDRKSILNYSNLQALRNEYMRQVAFLQSDLYPLAKCRNCPHALLQECHGGCLARRRNLSKMTVNQGRRFYQRRPTLSRHFIVGKWREPSGNDVDPCGEHYGLYCQVSGETEEIDKDLYALLSAADGKNTLDMLLGKVFGEIRDSDIHRACFRTIIERLVEKEILWLGPFGAS